jgi:hypothetical protein
VGGWGGEGGSHGATCSHMVLSHVTMGTLAAPPLNAARGGTQTGSCDEVTWRYIATLEIDLHVSHSGSPHMACVLWLPWSPWQLGKLPQTL